MNKKIIFFLTMAAICRQEAQSQSPERISYQAVVRNSAGVLISNKTVKARISILKDSVNGTNVYSETQTPKTNANGLMSLQIGGGTVVSGKFSNINWGSGTYFAKQEIDPEGGTNYTISGVNQMLSVPYALHAKNAEKCFQHYVGELYGGGVVFYVWKDTMGIEHGLIVNKYTLGGDSTPWMNRWDTIIGASSYWDGLGNSNKIVSTPGHKKSAAKLCLDHIEGGFDDWYLGSLNEFKFLYENIHIINNALVKYDKLALSENDDRVFSYWTSTEGIWNPEMAYVGYTEIGEFMAFRDGKGAPWPVRAFRKF